MFATLLSALFAIGVLLFPPQFNAQVPWTFFGALLLSMSFAVLLIQGIIQGLSWSPLQRAEKNLTPRVVELYRKDRSLNILNIILYLFPLLTLGIVCELLLFDRVNKLELIALWGLLFGISLDLLYHLYKRILRYFNPFGVVQMFTQAAKSSIQNEKEIDLCDDIDSLSEVAIKAIQQSGTSLANEAVSDLHQISRNFLEASKSISHITQNAEGQKIGIPDTISYTLFYLYQRLELIHEKALEAKLEPICSSVITSLGKIAIDTAKLDISLTSNPLATLGKCATIAQEKGVSAVGLKAMLTLQEVGKTIPQQVDIKFLELKDTYITLILQMHEISKAIFKQDKRVNIAFLTQPFRELKELFTSDPLSQHQDTPAIVNEINQVLGEFDALELIMKTIPPIPEVPTEGESGAGSQEAEKRPNA